VDGVAHTLFSASEEANSSLLMVQSPNQLPLHVHERLLWRHEHFRSDDMMMPFLAEDRCHLWPVMLPLYRPSHSPLPLLEDGLHLL